jgi:predicted metal-dependent phosphoesterase TrpH
MLKVELHTHTADDSVDRISYSATDLIDRAAALGYRALAITLHERQYDVQTLADYAAARDIVLIPGVERTIEGCHVLLINFPAAATALDTFEELGQLRQRHRGLVIAPHPFFPARVCLRKRLMEHAHLFDAVEYNAMYTRILNFNDAAVRFAKRARKPLVGNCDVHVLRQLGTTYSLVDAEPHAEAVCEAIRQGRVRVETRALTWLEATTILAEMTVSQCLGRRPSAPVLNPARV